MECKLQNIKYIAELRCLKLARSGSCISTTRALSIVQDYGDQACNKLICWLEPLKNFSSVRSNTVFIGSCQCTQNKYFLLLWFSIFKMDKYYISVGHLEVSFYLSELLWQHHIHHWGLHLTVGSMCFPYAPKCFLFSKKWVDIRTKSFHFGCLRTEFLFCAVV